MDKFCYCPVCQRDVEFIVSKKKRSFNDNGTKIYYYAKVANCSECGEELYVEDLEQDNQISFENEYKKTYSIITNDEIKAILEKYDITKRNLPYALGIGEQTITRYLDGYIPTPKISNMLKEVLNNPAAYRVLLEKNRSSLKESVYLKTKKQVDKLLNISEADSLIADIAGYIILNNPETTNLTLQKLLYYVELFYMLFNKTKLFETQCGAWDYGPVYGKIYYDYKEYGNNPIDNIVNNIEISKDLKELVDCVIENFGCYSGGILSNFTHNEMPWIQGRETKKNIIGKQSMIDYSQFIKNEYSISKYKDIEKYSNAMFKLYKKYKKLD